MLILGNHVNFGTSQLLGCAKQAVSYGANTFMFYTGAPQNTLRKDIMDENVKEAQAYMLEHDIDITKVICHAPYIVNLANQSNMEKWNFSVDFLANELKRCHTMGITKMVLHPGSAVGITKEEGIQHIIMGLNLILKKEFNGIILLETMAGKGTECGTSLMELKQIIDGVHDELRIGVCIDTCHINDAGIDIQDFSKYLREFERVIGLDKILCIHLNDSKNEIGMHKDRHENFGFGTIGFQNLLNVCYEDKLKEVPKILETPYVSKSEEETVREYPPYRFEIEMILNKVFNPNLKEDIRNFYK